MLIKIDELPYHAVVHIHIRVKGDRLLVSWKKAKTRTYNRGLCWKDNGQC